MWSRGEGEKRGGGGFQALFGWGAPGVQTRPWMMAFRCAHMSAFARARQRLAISFDWSVGYHLQQQAKTVECSKTLPFLCYHKMTAPYKAGLALKLALGR